ncbi:MAG: MMPL family transporter [Flavobacteriaceae bacterium]|nr:MMPL family transporter [Flavobacteriaceae bacterium]
MWRKIATLILRNRVRIMIGLIAFMACMVTCILVLGVKFTTSNAQLMPYDDPVMQNFRDFQKTFGNEANIITIGYKDDAMAVSENYQRFNAMTQEILDIPGITGIFSMSDAVKLTKDSVKGGFKPEKITSETEKTNWNLVRQKIMSFPFYESLMYNKDNKATQVIVYMDPEIVDSKQRISDVLRINKMVDTFEKETGIRLYLSGMPVIRTMNTEMVKSETAIFIFASLFATCLIFYLFFRSFRATAVAVSIVSSAVITCFATMAILGYEITLLTALVPPLLIVIGIPNCVYLLNKYQSEFNKHRNKIKALQRMIIHVGNPSMLTNLTTAFGFLTFIFTNSSTLREFGLVASINIIGIFIFSILIIPTAYSFFPEPKDRHLQHHKFNWTNRILGWMENLVINHRPKVYQCVAGVVVVALIGIIQIKTSGNMLDDMSKKARFYNDISFFDNEFGGILPLEISIDTKRANAVTSINVLNKMDEINHFIDSLDVSSKTLSVTELVKFAKQAYYNNDSAFYNLPTSQERAFILNEVRNTQGDNNLIGNYVDNTGSKARMTTMLQNLDSDKLSDVIEKIQSKLVQVFPQEQFDTYVTGVAYVFMKGTDFLTKNLIISLSLAILLIAILMAIMFRAPQMIFIALIPNILPLIATAGLMGYMNIPIKPSTILVFSIAFGIAVDDTIHFLAKYRQDLIFFKGNIRKSVELAMDEVGNSMFYTSVVLFAGFSVFLFSGFIGIVALGGLVTFTLIIAMFSNLILLPSLLMTYEKLSSKDFTEPDIDFFEEDDLKDDIKDLDINDLN